jgi:hypothetical protein
VDPCDTRLRFHDCAQCTSTHGVRHPREPSKWGRKRINTPRRESLDRARGVFADPTGHHPVVEPEAFAELHQSATLWTALRVAIHRPTRIAAFGPWNMTHWRIPPTQAEQYIDRSSQRQATIRCQAARHSDRRQTDHLAHHYESRSQWIGIMLAPSVLERRPEITEANCALSGLLGHTLDPGRPLAATSQVDVPALWCHPS